MLTRFFVVIGMLGLAVLLGLTLAQLDVSHGTKEFIA
ncbi:MAG: hypothetical protein ACI85H_000924 [Paracoccaceae bacterium]|jgi:hypothetical protein